MIGRGEKLVLTGKRYVLYLEFERGDYCTERRLTWQAIQSATIDLVQYTVGAMRQEVVAAERASSEGTVK